MTTSISPWPLLVTEVCHSCAATPLRFFAVSCPCADPTLSPHWILIIVICIQFALCYPIGSSEEVASQRTSWFLISSSWCLCCTSSYFFPLLFINKCKQIKRCLRDQWHMFKLGQREARLLLSYFHDQLATSSLLWVHFMVIVQETHYLSWGELMHLYTTVFFSSKAFDFRIFSLAQYRSSSYIFRLVISLPTQSLHIVFVVFLSHFVSILGDGFKCLESWRKLINWRQMYIYFHLIRVISYFKTTCKTADMSYSMLELTCQRNEQLFMMGILWSLALVECSLSVLAASFSSCSVSHRDWHKKYQPCLTERQWTGISRYLNHRVWAKKKLFPIFGDWQHFDKYPEDVCVETCRNVTVIFTSCLPHAKACMFQCVHLQLTKGPLADVSLCVHDQSAVRQVYAAVLQWRIRFRFLLTILWSLRNHSSHSTLYILKL